jgi:hypothetical protein
MATLEVRGVRGHDFLVLDGEKYIVRRADDAGADANACNSTSLERSSATMIAVSVTNARTGSSRSGTRPCQLVVAVHSA